MVKTANARTEDKTKARRSAAAALKAEQDKVNAEWRSARASVTNWAPGVAVGRATHDCGLRCATGREPSPCVVLDMSHEHNQMRIVIEQQETVEKIIAVMSAALKQMKRA